MTLPARPLPLPAGLLAGLLAVFAACSGGAPRVAPDPAPGVSRSLASHRARSLSAVTYDLLFRVPEDPGEAVEGRLALTLTRGEGAGPLVLDFDVPPPAGIRAARVDGAAVPHRLRDGHLILAEEPLGGGGEVTVEVEFSAPQSAFNRSPEYLYTLFVPDRARRAFPCFDQPDLKARYRLTLDLPAAWRAVANAPLAGLEEPAGPGRARWRFAETPPLPTYLFAFAAGGFEVESAERGGRPLRLFHRETDAALLARNREALFDLHAAALDYLEEYTAVPYPFAKFDFVLIPDFQYSGMEHPGAVLYRDNRLLLDESATQGEELGRASLIAHETAHMWFGDLVTMAWFDDVWLKEVFANFMAAKIAQPAFPELDHDLRFLLAHFPAAYAVDRTAGANPIRQPLDNLAEAGTLYGPIIYQKAPIVLRQLERLTGGEAFRDGAREYLAGHAFGNATWDDLIAIFDRRSDEDLAAWSRAWVDEAGRPAVSAAAEVAGGRLVSLALRQEDPRRRGLLWNQRLSVGLGYDGGRLELLPVHLAAERAEVAAAAGLPAPRFVLPGAAGLGYGRFALDGAGRAWLAEHLGEVAPPVARGAAWLALWDEMLEGRLPPARLVDLARRTLAAEGELQLVERYLADLEATYWRFLPAAERRRRAPELEAFLWRGIEEGDDPRRRASYLRAYRSMALSPAAVARLEALWRRDPEMPDLELSEMDETDLALALAVRQVEGWRAILEAHMERLDNPDRRARLVFLLPALDADPAVRAAFFDSLRDPAHREQEPWVLDALELLHHPLRAEASRAHLRPALEMLEEIQATGDIFFPQRWLDATLSGHASPEAAAIVRRFLAEHPAYPPRLRAKILQSADLLFRAAEPGSEP